MNKDKQRETIALACGGKWIYNPTALQPSKILKMPSVYMSHVEGFVDAPEHIPVWDMCMELEMMPDYLNDLNACHEMEKVLDPGQWDGYCQHLRNQVRGKGAQPRDISAIHATAAQRCEAFLKTLGLWDEDAS